MSPIVATPTHPRLVRGTPNHLDTGTIVRVLVYSPFPHRERWIESELTNGSVMTQIAHNVATIVTALVDDPPPRPQILIADFEALTAGELFYLHTLRERAWFGRIVALGAVPAELRRSLGVDVVLRPPFVRDTLREAINPSGFVAATTRIPVIER